MSQGTQLYNSPNFWFDTVLLELNVGVLAFCIRVALT